MKMENASKSGSRETQEKGAEKYLFKEREIPEKGPTNLFQTKRNTTKKAERSKTLIGSKQTCSHISL